MGGLAHLQACPEAIGIVEKVFAHRFR